MITIDILYLVDRLEELLNSGRHVPLTNKTMVDEDEILDIVDQMRISLPEEVKQARRTQHERERLVAQAHEESERIIALAKQEAARLLNDAREQVMQIQMTANEEAARLTNEHSVMKAAAERSLRIESEAKAAALATRRGADSYASEVLSELKSRLEQIGEQLGVLQNQVENGLSFIVTQSANPELEVAAESKPSNSQQES